MAGRWRYRLGLSARAADVFFFQLLQRFPEVSARQRIKKKIDGEIRVVYQLEILLQDVLAGCESVVLVEHGFEKHVNPNRVAGKVEENEHSRYEKQHLCDSDLVAGTVVLLVTAELVGGESDVTVRVHAAVVVGFCGREVAMLRACSTRARALTVLVRDAVTWRRRHRIGRSIRASRSHSAAKLSAVHPGMRTPSAAVLAAVRQVPAFVACRATSAIEMDHLPCYGDVHHDDDEERNDECRNGVDVIEDCHHRQVLLEESARRLAPRLYDPCCDKRVRIHQHGEHSQSTHCTLSSFDGAHRRTL